jgi:hypothetical protein
VRAGTAGAGGVCFFFFGAFEMRLFRRKWQ